MLNQKATRRRSRKVNSEAFASGCFRGGLLLDLLPKVSHLITTSHGTTYGSVAVFSVGRLTERVGYWGQCL